MFTAITLISSLTVAGLVGYALLCLFIARIAVRHMLQYPRKTEQETNEYARQHGIDIPSTLAAAQKHTITMADGAQLSALLFEGDAQRAIVCVHGASGNMRHMFKYVPLLRSLGFTLLLFDLRRYGAKPFQYPAFGHFEKRDLLDVIAWLRERLPQIRQLGLFGESMGGSTVLQAMPLCEDVSFVVADCPFSSTRAQVETTLHKKGIPSICFPLVLRLVDWMLQRRAGFGLDTAQSLRDCMAVDTPLLLIHGEADELIPAEMSRTIYHNRKQKAPTQMLVVPKAGHAQSIFADAAAYEQALRAFLRGRKDSETAK